MGMILTRRYNVDRFGYLIPYRYGNLPMVGAVATFRPGEGKFGRGAVAVEEGTTNLANNPTFSGAVGTTPSGWNSDVTIRQDDFFGQLINVAELLCVSGNTYEDFGTSIAYPLAYNTTYTISFWARGTMEPTYQLTPTRGIASATWKSKPPMSLQWQRYEVTIVTASSESIFPFWWFLLNVDDENVGKWVRIARIQLEQKPFATSFIDGTRANPTSLLTLPEPLPQEFGIGIAVKPLWGKDDPAGEGVWRRAFEAYIDGGNRLNIVWYRSSKTWVAEIYIDGVKKAAPLPASAFSAGDILYFYFEKRADKFRLAGKFAGGEIIYTDWKADDRPLPEFADIFIGSAVGGSSAANAVLADFVIHDRPEDIDPEGYLAGMPGGGST